LRLSRYVAQRALVALAASLVGVVVVFLAIDAADNPVAMEGPG
jgi:hypothetical protein